MKKVLIAMMMAAAAPAFAADPIDQSNASVNFYGKITPTTCGIDGDSQKVDVYLGEHSVSAVQNNRAPATPFSLKLIECENDTKKAHVTVIAAQDQDNAEMFRLTGATGAALELIADWDDGVLKPGVEAKGFPLTMNSNELKFFARLGTPKENSKIQPGDVSALTTFRIAYK
ncbi:fimbrial protein [Aeromonas sp. 601115]|uniref:fimbrial protein n=1 Tax=Aeromonas sp. 601115 TaxID=2712038 RepID=UPI003B9E45A2